MAPLRGGLKVTDLMNKPPPSEAVEVTAKAVRWRKQRMAMRQEIGGDEEQGVSVGFTYDGHVYVLGPGGCVEFAIDELAESVRDMVSEPETAA